jgi:hypothetical protein
MTDDPDRAPTCSIMGRETPTHAIERNGQAVLNPDQCRTISRVKSLVKAMVIERDQLERDRPPQPRSMWKDHVRRFDYLMGLSEEHFASLRLHTYHLDGDNYQAYFFGDPNLFRCLTGYDGLVKGLDPKWRLSAAETLGEFGYKFDGRVVNLSVVRFQRAVQTLVKEGILTPLESEPKRKLLLEVGGGYSCLGFHFNEILKKVTYVIVDLPETLLFSASYLSLTLPEARIYVYDGRVESALARPLEYDFILLPNYALPKLKHIRFDLALNMASFQEMAPHELTEYLEYIEAHCGVLYSVNQKRQPKNPCAINVTAEVAKRFQVKRIRPPFILLSRAVSWFAFLGYSLGLKRKPQGDWEELLGWPKRGSSTA